MHNKYNPTSKIELNQTIDISEKLCDAMLNLIVNLKSPVENYVDTLLVSMINVIKKTKAILKLVSLGYENEAFILWRSLHEEECILFVLNKYGEVAANAFENHESCMVLNYENLEVNDLISKEMATKLKSDILIMEEKLINEMSRFSVKNRKGFIDYGWLLSIDDFNSKFQKKEVSLSFTGGLQKFAEQNHTNQEFSYSSKYIHSTYHAQKNKKNRDLLNLVLIDAMNSLKNVQSIFNAFIVKHKLIERNHDYTFDKQMDEILGEFKNELFNLIAEISIKMKTTER
ncbi:MAG: hypothetical protein KKH92_06135 [Firmicutes bacterium]|nr:hypothetical protein [Bacillota bacterium]